MQLGLFSDGNPWRQVEKCDPDCVRLADRHYSRRKVGSPQFMPPGQTIVLITPERDAVFGWWRPHPDSGLEALNGLDGWTCTIFRNEGRRLSSELVLAAERSLLATRFDIGPDGLLTYVWDERLRSTNPGYCFKVAGWKVAGKSWDGRKTLLQKLVEPCGYPRPSRSCSLPSPTTVDLASSTSSTA